MTTAPLCNECGSAARLTTGAEIYPHRADLAAKPFWRCATPGCNSWCGCHPGTDAALGTPAGRATRDARQDAHISFDAIWRSGAMTRHGAYRWLSEATGMKPQDCHISLMTESQARDVVRACDRRRNETKERRPGP